MKIALLFSIMLASVIVCAAQEKPRVFISDSRSWTVSIATGGTDGTIAGSGGGGDRPQTAEIIKTFGERCPNVIINNNKNKADYVVLLDHEGGKDLFLRDNKVVVFNKDGDSVMSHSTRTLGNAVKDACGVIVEDWPRQRAKGLNATENQTAVSGINR